MFNIFIIILIHNHLYIVSSSKLLCPSSGIVVNMVKSNSKTNFIFQQNSTINTTMKQSCWLLFSTICFNSFYSLYIISFLFSSLRLPFIFLKTWCFTELVVYTAIQNVQGTFFIKMMWYKKEFWAKKQNIFCNMGSRNVRNKTWKINKFNSITWNETNMFIVCFLDLSCYDECLISSLFFFFFFCIAFIIQFSMRIELGKDLLDLFIHYIDSWKVMGYSFYIYLELKTFSSS